MKWGDTDFKWEVWASLALPLATTRCFTVFFDFNLLSFIGVFDINDRNNQQKWPHDCCDVLYLPMILPTT